MIHQTPSTGTAVCLCNFWCLQLEIDEVEHEKEQVRLAELHKQAWEEDIQEKRRLQRMLAAKDRLANDIMSRRTAEFEQLKVCLCSP